MTGALSLPCQAKLGHPAGVIPGQVLHQGGNHLFGAGVVMPGGWDCDRRGVRPLLRFTVRADHQTRQERMLEAHALCLSQGPPS